MRASLSLRKRLTWYVVVTVLTMTALSGVLIYQGTSREAEQVFSASLVQTARILDGLISRETLESNRRQLKRALERDKNAHEYERKLFFAVLDSDGSMLLHSRKAPNLPETGVKPGFSGFKHDGRKWFTFALESSQDDLLIVVGERGEVRDEITEYIGSGLLLPLIIMLPLLLWLLWQLVGIALKPLQKVTDQVRQQDLRRLQAIDVSGVPLEISPLVDALNQMISDLEAAYSRERRFVSDASHELRNPLASLLINVDNAIEETQDTDALDSLQSMKQSILRLTHLVSQLLVLSHLENPGPVRSMESIDLMQVCASVVQSLQSEADEKSITLEIPASAESCELPGVRPLLESLVTNLVDNAVRYCRSGDRVKLSCHHHGSELLLRVEDSGPGLDEVQRANASARFYRAADAGSRGAGLGLSIVDTIAQSHSGQLELSQSELGGLCVTVRFKLA